MSIATTSQNKPHRRWLIPAITSIVTLVVGVFGKIIAPKVQSLFGGGYFWMIWLIFAIASVVTIITAIIEARQSNESSALGGVINFNVHGGDISVGRDVIGRDKISIDSSITAGNIDQEANVAIGHGASVTVIKQITAPSATALHQLPPPPRDFTGRSSEIAELMMALEKGGITISGLHGMGGIGKTALALKLAEQLISRYPDAQFFLDLKGVSPQSLSAIQAMTHVIRAYYPAEKLSENETELSALYRSVLHGKRTLLLMDNARDIAQVEPLVPPATCCLLVTSRQHFTLPGLYAKNLETLPPRDASDLLLTIAPRINGQADKIAKLCEYLPLALRLAASVLAERLDLSPADYVRRLTDAQTRLGLVESSPNLSYELIDPNIQKLWRLLGVFPDTFDKLAAATLWNLTPDKAYDISSNLAAYSLVEWKPATNRYRLHDLVRLFADTNLSEDERAVGKQCHAAYYKTILRNANELYEQGGNSLERGLAAFDLEWGNIQAGQAWAAVNARNDKAIAELCSDYAEDGANLFDLRQDPRERIRYLEAALAATRHLKRRSAESVHLGNLGTAYVDIGETHKAIECYEQALTITRKIGHRDRHGEGATLGSLGLAYADLGETRKAIEFYEQRIVIAREIGDRRGEGNALGNLGNAYAALGEIRKAIRFHEKQLVITREIGDRRGEGFALGNLGNAYASLGETRKAIEFYEQQLVITREIGDRRSEDIALGNLDNAYVSLDKARKDIEFYEQQLVTIREIGDHHRESIALDNLDNAYYALDVTPKAIEFYEQQLVSTHESSDRSNESAISENLGYAYVVIGEPRKAIEFYEQQLIITREISDRRGEGRALCNLGNACTMLDKISKSFEYNEQSLAITHEISDYHVESRALNNFGIAYNSMGKIDKAIEHYEQSLSIARKIGARFEEGKVLLNLSVAYIMMGKFRKAIEYYEQSLTIVRKIGARHIESIVLGNLGHVYNASGKMRKAAVLLKQHLLISREIGDRFGEFKTPRRLLAGIVGYGLVSSVVYSAYAFPGSTLVKILIGAIEWGACR